MNRIRRLLKRRRTYREEILADKPVFYWPGDGTPAYRSDQDEAD